MTTITVKAEGADELRAVLARAQDVFLPQDLKYAHELAAEVVIDSANPHVPRRSGALVKTLQATGTVKSGYAKVGAGLAYGNAIHWGRKVGNVGSPPGNHRGPSTIVGRPFLVEAAKRSQGQIVDQFEKAMDKLVQQIEGA